MPPINAVKLLEELIACAMQENASDIHFEPKPDGLQIKLRVDGDLRASRMLENVAIPLLSTRIKVLAGMDTSQSRLPQDGRFSYEQLDLRVSTMPMIFGEKIVIRVLNKQDRLRTLADLGMGENNLPRYLKLLHSPNGLILVTGPTGSGKTTTLYASILELLSGPKNITTVEDPVEYQIPQINQVQINEKAGLTFPTVLRSIL
ncbi:MAG: ATPase, T2SS/T4P/T4SS family, partial [Candidatus Margulisiibacteriota bacterium]